jgi:hypothetical protein
MKSYIISNFVFFLVVLYFMNWVFSNNELHLKIAVSAELEMKA